MATFTNQAVLSYNGVTTSSNVATGEIVEVLSASKDVLSPEYAAGDTVTYVINIINSGSTPFTALTVTDNLGAYTHQFADGSERMLYPLTYVDGSVRYYQNGAEQAVPGVTQTAGLTVSGIGVPAGGNTTLIYQAKTNDFADPQVGGTITNTAVISGAEVAAPITVRETITARSEPYLTILKSVAPRQVAENGQITYTFDIQNLSNTAATADDNVQITDTYQPVLSNITVTYNGAILPAASYTYNETTGEFATTADALTVPAAVFTQNDTTGAWSSVPGSAVLTVTGTI